MFFAAIFTSPKRVVGVFDGSSVETTKKRFLFWCPPICIFTPPQYRKCHSIPHIQSVKLFYGIIKHGPKSSRARCVYGSLPFFFLDLHQIVVYALLNYSMHVLECYPDLCTGSTSYRPAHKQVYQEVKEV